MSSHPSCRRPAALAALTTLLVAGLLVAVSAPVGALGPDTARLSADRPGCPVVQQRLVRTQQRVRSLERRLREARAKGSVQRVRRTEVALRDARARRAELRDNRRRACTGPQTQVMSGPRNGAVVQGRIVPFRWGSPAPDVKRFECSLDGRPWHFCGYRDGRTSFTLSDGRTHTARVRAVDRFGYVDRTPLVRTFAARYWTHVAAGGYRSCGIVIGGAVRCWGRPFPDDAQPPSGRYRSLDLGRGDHACAVDADNDLVTCWGDDSTGQASPPPGTTAGPDGQVHVGGDHTCTELTCWGDDSAGESSVPAGTSVSAAGDDYTCGDGGPNGYTVQCWGDPREGRTVVPPVVDALLDVGDDRACGLDRAGVVRLVCWGAPFPEPDPADIPGLEQLAIGGDHACGVTAGGNVSCWGDDTFTQTDLPQSILADGAGHLSAGRNHTCTVNFGAITCWGDDRSGQSTPPPA